MTWTGSDSLKEIKIPPLLILLGWSTLTKLYLSILNRPSGIVESRSISDRHLKSCLYNEIYDFNCVM